MSQNERAQFTIVFEFEKATKNTYKYEERPEPGQPRRVGTLYIQKWVVGSETPPRQLVATVQFGSDIPGKGQQ